MAPATDKLDAHVQELIRASQRLLGDPTSDFRNGAGDKATKIIEAGGVLLGINTKQPLPAATAELLILLGALKARISTTSEPAPPAPTTEEPPFVWVLPAIGDEQISNLLERDLKELREAGKPTARRDALQRRLDAAQQRNLSIEGFSELVAYLASPAKPTKAVQPTPEPPAPTTGELGMPIVATRPWKLPAAEQFRLWMNGVGFGGRTAMVVFNQSEPVLVDLSTDEGELRKLAVNSDCITAWEKENKKEWEGAKPFLDAGRIRPSEGIDTTFGWLAYKAAKAEGGTFIKMGIPHFDEHLHTSMGNNGFKVFRLAWFESDNGSHLEQRRRIRRFEQATGIKVWLVSSGGKSIHGFIPFDSDQPYEEVEVLIRLLAALLNADATVATKHRHMRVPGFPRPGKKAKQQLLQVGDAPRPLADVRASLEKLLAERGLPSPEKKKSTLAATISNLQVTQQPWHRARTLDEIKEALAMMPVRRSGLETYKEDRKVLSGLASALAEVELERGHAVTLASEAGWEGWNPQQVLGSSNEMTSDTFWAHARKCGWKPKEEKVAEEERLRRQATQQEFRSDLLELHEQNLTADELTAALMNLAVNHRQQYISVRKAYDELLENERGIERLTEVLDLITTAKQEDPITVRELASEQFCSEVIDDFRQRFVADDLMVLMLVLTTMSSVLPIGTMVRLLDYTLHDQSALLYLLILTSSGGKKTMLFDQLVEGPILASGVKERADKTYRRVQRQQAAAQAKKAAKKKGKDAEPETAPQPDPDAGIAPEEGDTTPESSSTAVPIDVLRHLVGDLTGEGIDRNCQQAARHYGHGFLIGTDEGRQLMSGDQYKGGGSTYTIDKLTRLYDGKGNNQVRGNRNNERNYDKSHVAIAALLQPEIYDDISAKAADDESGFWPRFLTLQCGPIQTRKLNAAERNALPAPCYPAALQRIYDYANQLGNFRGADQLGKAPHFRFSPEAQDWWIDRNYEIEDQQLHEANNGDPLVGRLLGKAAGQVGRLAVLLHILDKAIIGDLSDIPSVEIPLETVQTAYRLQARLLSRTIRQRLRVHNGGATDDAALLKDVQKRCLEKDPNGLGLKLGSIERFWNQRNRPTKEDLYQAVTALAVGGFGEVTRSSNNRGGFIYIATTPLPA